MDMSEVKKAKLLKYNKAPALQNITITVTRVDSKMWATTDTGLWHLKLNCTAR